MTSAEIVEQKQNLESYFLIWLDANVNNSEENLEAQRQLRSLINYLITFDDDHQCENYIQTISKDDRIVLIVSGQLGRQFVPRVHQLQQISAIYVYCIDREQHQQWAKDFKKIKAVGSNLDDLIEKILEVESQRQNNRSNEPIPFSIFSADSNGEEISTSGINGYFINSQLIINCLIRMTQILNEKDEFISLCRRQYERNDEKLKTLQEFEENYSPLDAIWWYSRQSFLYRILNKSLRVQNIDLLYSSRFIIRDIERQLQENKCTSPIRVYRGQLMSKAEIEILKNSIGQYISINSFFSTSINRELALFFISGSNMSNNVEYVLFEIDADPHLKNIKPFSNITSFSHFSAEEEVLFMIGSIFQLVKIDRNDDGIWIIQLKLCSEDDLQLKPLLDFLRMNIMIQKII